MFRSYTLRFLVVDSGGITFVVAKARRHMNLWHFNKDTCLASYTTIIQVITLFLQFLLD